MFLELTVYNFIVLVHYVLIFILRWVKSCYRNITIHRIMSKVLIIYIQAILQKMLYDSIMHISINERSLEILNKKQTPEGNNVYYPQRRQNVSEIMCLYTTDPLNASIHEDEDLWKCSQSYYNNRILTYIILSCFMQFKTKFILYNCYQVPRVQTIGIFTAPELVLFDISGQRPIE